MTTLGRPLALAATSTLVGLTQSLGLNLVTSNLANLQASLSASAAEANWLTTAYFVTALPATLLLVKFRRQFGLRLFAFAGIGLFLLAAFIHLFVDTLSSAIFARAALVSHQRPSARWRFCT